MKNAILIVFAVATSSCLLVMFSLMQQYAADLESERAFIMTSTAAVKSAFDEFSVATEALLLQNYSDSNYSKQGVPSNHESRSQLSANFESKKKSAGADISAELKDWTTRFLGPSLCEQQHRRNVFHLHMRKAAGTTVRSFLEGVTQKSRSNYIESEGVSISRQFRPLEGITTVLSMRHPVERVFSMYWYEHVAWWHDIKKDMSKCSTMKNWIEAWRDGSAWKTEFIQKNPGSTYVEIENYYVKTLSGWTGPAKVTRADLEVAKKVLQDFDVVIIAEWLKNDTQKKFLK